MLFKKREKIEDKKENKVAGTYSQAKDETSNGGGTTTPWWGKILDFLYK